MSTFGNKGERERNPSKPKFAALDINSLYRSTRGETFEPATQKNAAPRKHGMQSLGKVPSARRPPANLPSLKAETSTPTSPAQTTNEQQHQQQQQQQYHHQSANWADSNSNSGGGSQQQNSNAAVPQNNSNNNSNQGQGNQQGASSNNNNSSSTWSAVAIGNVKEDSALQPPLYQSPQFQNEFPSLDGTLMTTTSSSMNASATTQLQNQNSFDSGGGGANLRPSTDAASWMQQQQSNSGNARGAGGENGQQNFPITDVDGPPKVMALMPSFLRGASTGIGSIAPERNINQHQQQNLHQSNKPNNMGNNRRQNMNNNSSSSQHYNEYSNGLPPPRHRQQPPRHSGRQNNNNNHNNNDDRSSSYEPEMVVQRPIIKEEELERIDSLARDDAWSKHDEIDYNKKLQFSDDEAEDMKPKDYSMEKKADAWRDIDKRDVKQNGPRSIDPSYIEKVKMVRDEEERMERERKIAAQRKLQELEEKSKQKMQINLDKSHEKELDEKPQTTSGINYTINDSEKKMEHHSQQQQQRDYGKTSKYSMSENKYDTYDSQYGRNMSRNTTEDFKKTNFQSNLPPRFQKQHQHIDDRRDRPDDRREKVNQQGGGYKPLHQQDSKNIPFVQHPPSSSYEQQQRWVQYNKGNNQQGPPPRRNMSSLSQSSSDDNRQNNIKQQSGYNPRRRQESEEDDYGRYAKDTTIKKSTLQTSSQISRSMSDSSDKLSDHNRSEKSTSREYLSGANVCWAEVCENDKRLSLDAKEKRRVSESSAISDDQPRTILQRNKPIQEQMSMKELKKENSKEMMTKEDEQKTVLNESPPKDNVVDSESSLKKEKLPEAQTVTAIEQQMQQQSKKSLEIIPEKEQQHLISGDKNQGELNQQNKDMKSKDMSISSKEMDDRHSGSKRSPHSNRYDQQSQSQRGRGGSYGGYRGSSWPRRGSGHQRSGRYDYSDSENSEDHDWNRGSKGRKDINRRENYGASSNAQKEGFSPRGEPSRRGRGGGMTGSSQSSSSFRRTGSNVSNSSITAPVKRIDNYGPPSSKSPFGSNDEKSSNASEKKDTSSAANASKDKDKLSDDDRTKQKQKALADGLINKSMKENSNLATQKASSPSAGKSSEDSSNKQHSNESQASSQAASNPQDVNKKEIDEKSSEKMSTRPIQQPYNANRQQKYDQGKPTSNAMNKPTVGKPVSNAQQPSTGGKMSQTSSAPSSTTTNVSNSSSSSQYNAMGSKPVDSRNTMNSGSSYRREDQRAREDPRNSSSNRMAPRFVKQQREPSGNQGRSGNYWDKNNSENDDGKVSLMQQLSNASNNNNHASLNNAGSSSLNNSQSQQVSSSAAAGSNSNILNSKTDVMKQTSQTSQPQQAMTSSSTTPSSSNQPMLDGASLPKQTLIFENTSYKTAPPSLKRPPPQLGPQGAMNQHPQQKDSTPTINEMIEQQAKDHSLSSALQNLSFGQKSNDMVDMNFKFSFDTQLTDDGNAGFGSSTSSTHASQTVSKASSLGLVGAKTGMQHSNILNTDALNMKVASCKKVWEEPSVDHNSSNSDDVMANFVAQQQLQHYAAHNNINAHHTGLSPQAFGYATSSANDHVQSSLEHFNKSNDNDDNNSYPSPHMSAAHVMHSQNQQNMNMKAVEAFSASGNVCKVKPTQQQMHQSGLSPPPQLQQSQLQQHQQQYYQTPNYANIPTIPSPPVVYNSAQATAGGLYNPYNMDAARAQMYSYPAGSATNNSLSFNAFMQTPNLASAPTHEMYQNLSQYRATVQPFNQTPQLNNPNAAVLISSATASNSMMASKSNTPQQIGAIGSKSSAPQSTGPTAGQYNQQYMNHLYHQNSYYPNSTAQQANPYYNATGTATTGNYGMFGGTTSAPPQQQMNYGSVGQFPINSQMLNNLVINQQYRSGPVVNASSSSNGASATSGSNSNTAGGYMKQQQQHQSQLQDPAVKYSNTGDSHKGYNNNWDISTSLSSSSSYSNSRGYNNSSYSTSQNPSQQQRIPKNSSSNQLFSNLPSGSGQGKSQFYNNKSDSSQSYPK